MSAPLRLQQDSGTPTLRVGPHAERGGTQDPIAGWLDVLTKMLPPRQGAEVREELEEHVRERVRDLVLAGQNDAAATRAAIAELGDAAAVAQRFRDAARTPFRRLAMNFAVLGVAGAALMTSLVGVMRPGSGPGGQVYQPAVAERVPGGKEPGLPALNLTDLGLEEALSTVAKSAGAALLIRWSSLGGGGLEPETRVTWSAPAGSLSGVFDSLNDALARDLGGEGLIDFRLREGVLEVARPEWFDRRESTLVRYDLGPIEDQGVDLAEFMGLVEQFVSPEDWETNGGELGKHRVVGRFAFVKGPPRIHDGVRWFLAQFTEQEAPVGGPGAAAGDDVRVYPIQHTNAQDLLKVLMQMQSIREVDFTPWAADPRTNSIMGRAPAKHQEMITRAIRDLDKPEAADGDPVRVYPIQHTNADDLLKVLMQMQSIREVDFTPWAADAQNNSIFGRAPAKHHDMVARAIKDLDSPEVVLKRRAGQKNAEMRAVIAAQLAQHEQERALLEAELRAMAQRGITEDHLDFITLRARLKEAADREAEARARLLMLEHESAEGDADRRGAAEAEGRPLAEGLAREQAFTAFLTDTLAERPVLDTQPLLTDLVGRARIQLALEPTIDASSLVRLRAALVLAEEPEPITRALLMAHADAGAVAEALRAAVRERGEPYLCIEVDTAHNTVILRGPGEHVLAAEEVAWKLDHLASVLPQRRE